MKKVSLRTHQIRVIELQSDNGGEGLKIRSFKDSLWSAGKVIKVGMSKFEKKKSG